MKDSRLGELSDDLSVFNFREPMTRKGEPNGSSKKEEREGREGGSAQARPFETNEKKAMSCGLEREKKAKVWREGSERTGGKN